MGGNELLPLLLMQGGHSDRRSTRRGRRGHLDLLPLLLLLLGKDDETTETTTCCTDTCHDHHHHDDCDDDDKDDDAESFNEVLAGLVGCHVKLALSTSTLIGANSVVTGCLQEVGSDFIVLDKIVINGVPVVDPKRLVIRIGNVLGVECLSKRSILTECLFRLLDC